MAGPSPTVKATPVASRVTTSERSERTGFNTRADTIHHHSNLCGQKQLPRATKLGVRSACDAACPILFGGGYRGVSSRATPAHHRAQHIVQIQQSQRPFAVADHNDVPALAAH